VTADPKKTGGDLTTHLAAAAAAPINTTRAVLRA
jgi:hypothetical protein